jgi:hypothetical protein
LGTGTALTISGTTLTYATPFTLGATSVTTTGTQLNYLNAATGTTGTTSSNVVFSAAPVFTTSISTPSIITASGALGITPASGSNLNVTLGTTGDLAVNTNQLYVDTSAARVGVNTSSPAASFHVIKTTEQLRLGYDASNYLSATVASTGSTTFALTGTTPTFTFSQGSTFSSGITLSTQNIVTDTTTGTKLGTATDQKLGFHNSTPTIQRAGAAQAQVATTGAALLSYGYTEAQANGIVALLNEIQAVLVENGLMKGSA